jgi:hypothetical protein
MKQALSFALAFASLPAFATNPVVDKLGKDAQVVHAWLAESVAPDASAQIAIDLKLCEGPEVRPNFRNTKDCSRQVEALAQLPGHGSFKTSPLMTRFLVNEIERGADGRVHSRFAYGHLVDIRLAVLDSALAQPSFRGIGFWSTNDGSIVVDPSRLHTVGHTKLKTGEDVTIFRFLGWMPAVFGESKAKWDAGHLGFKAFSVHADAQGETHVWEEVEGNFDIARTTAFGGESVIDRRADLLVP